MSDLPARATEIRRIAVSLIHGAGSGHPGSCLSAADIIAALYSERCGSKATAAPLKRRPTKAAARLKRRPTKAAAPLTRRLTKAAAPLTRRPTKALRADRT